MQAVAERDGIDLARSYGYSDSATDKPMLEAVGHPVVVNPDRELLRAAKANGWEVRRFTHRVPLRYEPSLWSMVFPMGMYAVAATYLSEADHLPLVGVVGAIGIWFAFAVWLVVFVAMLVDFARAAAGTAAGVTVNRRSDTSTY